MSYPLQHQSDSDAANPLGAADHTLRLVAKLPAPDGLADRVQAAIEMAPPRARLFSWPARSAGGLWLHTSMARGAAAAAIVMVVVGGGWRVYSRIPATPVAPAARVLVMPSSNDAFGKFGSANGRRVPDTPGGTVINHTAVQPIAEDAAVKTQSNGQTTSIAVRPVRKAGAKSKHAISKQGQVTTASRP